MVPSRARDRVVPLLQFLRGGRDYLMLPPEITLFERAYLRPLLPIGLVLLWLHLPVLVAIAAWNGTKPPFALVATLGVLAVPTVAFAFRHARPRIVTKVFGVASVTLCALLVHFGQGPKEEQLHLHFLVVLAGLTVFGDPLVIVSAALLAIGWQVVLDGSPSTMAIHALFIAIETAGACYAARRYFDHVVGLEAAVVERTAALTARNAQLQLVLDSAEQGFAIVRRDGTVSTERSGVLATWLGEPGEGETLWSWIARSDAEVGGWIEVAWDVYASKTLPAEIALAQIPSRLHAKGRVLAIGLTQTEDDLVFLVVNDVTAKVEREHAAAVEHQLLNVVRLAMRDREALEEFLAEGGAIVERVLEPQGEDITTLQRLIHTLKGNSALLGLDVVARLCHAIEDHIAEEGTLRRLDVMELDAVWSRLVAHSAALGLSRSRSTVEVDESLLLQLSADLRAGADPELVAHALDRARLEPVAPRLQRLGNEAAETARALGKPEPTIVVTDEDVWIERRFRPFWASLVHVVRNAVDHGVEPPEERAARGKAARGTMRLAVRLVDERFVVEIQDDGRGVDWTKIRARAEAAGLRATTEADLVAALLADGISTRDTVTETSGRGVGMAALRAEVEALGGHLEIRSAPGQGTTVRCAFERTLTERFANASGLHRVAAA